MSNPEDDPPGSAYQFLLNLILPPDPLPPHANKPSDSRGITPNARKPD